MVHVVIKELSCASSGMPSPLSRRPWQARLLGHRRSNDSWDQGAFFSISHTVSALDPSVPNKRFHRCNPHIHLTNNHPDRAESSKIDGPSKQSSNWDQSHNDVLHSMLSTDSATDIKCLGWWNSMRRPGACLRTPSSRAAFHPQACVPK